MRSFTEPNGFWLSILARMRTRGFGLSGLTSTSGVLPIMSSGEPYTAVIEPKSYRIGRDFGGPPRGRVSVRP